MIVFASFFNKKSDENISFLIHLLICEILPQMEIRPTNSGRISTSTFVVVCKHTSRQFHTTFIIPNNPLLRSLIWRYVLLALYGRNKSDIQIPMIIPTNKREIEDLRLIGNTETKILLSIV